MYSYINFNTCIGVKEMWPQEGSVRECFGPTALFCILVVSGILNYVILRIIAQILRWVFCTLCFEPHYSQSSLLCHCCDKSKCHCLAHKPSMTSYLMHLTSYPHLLPCSLISRQTHIRLGVFVHACLPLCNVLTFLFPLNAIHSDPSPCLTSAVNFLKGVQVN